MYPGLRLPLVTVAPKSPGQVPPSQRGQRRVRPAFSITSSVVLMDHTMALPPAIDTIAEHTSSPEARANTVLVLSGTGVNMWHYYQFLRQFSLQALSEFSHIYGISGGAV